MKTIKLYNSIQQLLLAAALVFNPVAAFTAENAQPGDPLPNSFKEVTSKLDIGGNLLLYLSTESWLKNLSGEIGKYKEVMQALPDIQDNDRAVMGVVFGVITRLIQSSGVEEISGVGMSGIRRADRMYHSRIFLHHYRQNNKGVLWSLPGRKPHALTGLDMLPETTVLAGFFDLDLPLAWNYIQEQIRQTGLPEGTKLLEQANSEFNQKTGLKLEDAINSLGGAYGLVFTLDESHLVSLSLPNGAKLEFPEPALALVVQIKNDQIFKRFDTITAQDGRITRVDKDGYRARMIPSPVPQPFELVLTVVQAGDYLYVASNEKIVQQILAVKNGQAKGLKSTPEFQQLAMGMPTEGNNFDFVSGKFGRTVARVQGDVLRAQERNVAMANFAQRIFGMIGEKHAYTVEANTEEGWLVTINNNQEPVMTLLAPMVMAPVAITAVGAGMLLPALAKARGKAESIKCINNLKQIGLGARIYATDHDDILPKDFVSMKAELSTPRILFCPLDKTQNPETMQTWDTFKQEASSYEIVSPGATETTPDKVFARCRLHGHEVKVDGSVQMKNR